MRMFSLLVPMGTCFITGCADFDGNVGSAEGYNNQAEGTEEGDVTESLRGDYESCEEALAGLGFTPWTNFVPEETADLFQVVGPNNSDLEAENPRPWIATLSYADTELGYYITCTEFSSSSLMWVQPDQFEYWTCTFEANRISILDPGSDPSCTKGIEAQAVRADAREEEVYLYDQVSTGHFVAQE